MILGPLMRMLYQMIPNFAVTMIVFTVIIKLLMLPLMIKQQKSMAKMSVFTPMINEIQQKYKNNQEKMQEEMVKLQQELKVLTVLKLINVRIEYFENHEKFKNCKHVKSVGTASRICPTLGKSARRYFT